MTYDTPNLPSIDKQAVLYPNVFRITDAKGKVLVEMNTAGVLVLAPEMSSKQAAAQFWKDVRDQVMKEDIVGVKRDLALLVAFLNGKGVIFTNPQERIELGVWLGEIQRRYGL